MNKTVKMKKEHQIQVCKWMNFEGSIALKKLFSFFDHSNSITSVDQVANQQLMCIIEVGRKIENAKFGPP